MRHFEKQIFRRLKEKNIVFIGNRRGNGREIIHLIYQYTLVACRGVEVQMDVYFPE